MLWLLLHSLLFLQFTVVLTDYSFPEFQIYWNVPSVPCKKLGINLKLNDYGIITNKDEEFLGDQIVIFYEKKFGLCPYYKNYDPNQPINGGLPQNVSVEEHLAVVEKQILETIPDPNFSGIAVYKDQSIKFARNKYPKRSMTEIKKLAEKDYNRAAKTFFMRTMKKARELRPKALWGFYDFPFCNYKAFEEKGYNECSAEAQRYNDKMAFIYNTTRVLYPSIYLNGKRNPEQNFRFNRALLNEAMRIARAQKRRVDFYAYSKFEYDPYTQNNWFYNKKDMCNTMKLPSDHGASGLVLWSTSAGMRSRCANYERFLRRQLGPFLQIVKKQVSDCRDRMCSGNGNCILKKPLERCYENIKDIDYQCHCDLKFQGPNCSEVTSTSSKVTKQK